MLWRMRRLHASRSRSTVRTAGSSLSISSVTAMPSRWCSTGVGFAGGGGTSACSDNDSRSLFWNALPRKLPERIGCGILERPDAAHP